MGTGHLEQLLKDRTKQEEAGRAFREAFTRISKGLWKIILVGSLLGITLSVSGDLWVATLEREQIAKALKNQDVDAIVTICRILAYAIKDIGLGLIVSTVAVWGFEIASEVAGLIKQKKELEAKYLDLSDAADALKTFSNPEYTVHLALRNLFPDNENEAQRKFIEVIENTIKNAHSLIKDSDTVEGEKYLYFLGSVLEKVAFDNADSLAKLVNSIRTKDKRAAPWIYNIPDTREIASQILAKQLSCLNTGDYHYAVSDVLYWEKNPLKKDVRDEEQKRYMKEFLFEIRSALKRGVKIKRLFNISNFSMRKDLRTEKLGIANEIVKMHLELVKEFPNLYEIRFFSPILRDQVRIRPRPVHFPLFSFAIFVRNVNNNQPYIIRFKAEDAKLSGMKLFYHPTTKAILRELDSNNSELDISNLNENEQRLKLFYEMWDLSANIQNPFFGTSFPQEHILQAFEALKQKD